MTDKRSAVRLEAMRWSQTDLCKIACNKAGVSHEHFIGALRYLAHAGGARAPVAFRQLKARLLRITPKG